MLRERGARLIVAATSERIRDRAAELGDATVAVDRRPDRRRGDRARARRGLGPVDVLVNNAGMVQTGEPAADAGFLELSEAAWLRGIDLNLHTAFRLCRLVAPAMAARGWGRIVNVSSVTGPLRGAARLGRLRRRQGRASTASRARWRSSSGRAA